MPNLYSSISPALEERARRIELIVLDVDGTLTDGLLVFTDSGEEIKRFHVRDGHGIVMARRVGLKFVAVSGRRSRATLKRMREWGIEETHQKIWDKETFVTQLLQRRGLDWSQLAYMADDVVDLRAMRRCGLALAPADAVPEIHATAHWVSTLGGGCGAVREALEWILKAKGLWDKAMEPYR